MGRGPDGRYLERWVGDEAPRDLTWAHTHVLQFVRPTDAHTVEVFWDESWSLLGWYVNLQAPLRRTALGFDTTDWALDIWVEPGGAWQWKDEDDFAEAIQLGVFDEVSAAAVRAEGQRVIAERPWPTGWEDWRPPASWEPLSLPFEWVAADSGSHDAEVTVRRAAATDGMILRDVRLRALRSDPTSFTEVLADVEHDPDVEWVQWAAEVSATDSDSAVFLAFGADRTIALGMAGGFLRGEPYNDARVFGVWLDPVVRGSGISRLLVEEVIAWARTRGRPRLALCVMETSAAAIALYRSVGFDDDGCAAPSSVHDGASELAMVLVL
jgi:GNAT superfamily N-acetyltransferase